jgi:hypothetical protein
VLIEIRFGDLPQLANSPRSSRRTRRIQVIKTLNFVLFVSFVVKIYLSTLVAVLPRELLRGASLLCVLCAPCG